MNKKTNKLKEYKERRNLKESKEPTGKEKHIKLKHPIYVIQKHDATRLHYDFRIEIDGVLKSWAIPKGPSLNPKVKRLAIPTDDHPLKYAEFEGIIPEGNYGAGTVMVWDIGTYNNVYEENGKKIDMKKCYKQGEIKINIKGKKIKGSYVLVRTKNKTGKKNQWLLIKKDDKYADARRNPTSTENKSALSGKTMKEIEKGFK
ncbi:DNA ligase [Candidatus Dependentiae bacterium]|nr:DNA ligase [Candidatus Dependentiae bacterium]